MAAERNRPRISDERIQTELIATMYFSPPTRSSAQLAAPLAGICILCTTMAAADRPRRPAHGAPSGRGR